MEFRDVETAPQAASGKDKHPVAAKDLPSAAVAQFSKSGCRDSEVVLNKSVLLVESMPIRSSSLVLAKRDNLPRFAHLGMDMCQNRGPSTQNGGGSLRFSFFNQGEKTENL